MSILEKFCAQHLIPLYFGTSQFIPSTMALAFMILRQVMRSSKIQILNSLSLPAQSHIAPFLQSLVR